MKSKTVRIGDFSLWCNGNLFYGPHSVGQDGINDEKKKNYVYRYIYFKKSE